MAGVSSPVIFFSLATPMLLTPIDSVIMVIVYRKDLVDNLFVSQSRSY